MPQRDVIVENLQDEKNNAERKKKIMAEAFHDTK